jgi:hypothetical protein
MQYSMAVVCLLRTSSVYEIEQYEKLMKLRELIGLTKDWHIGTKQEKDMIFEDVVGYDDIKRVFRMVLLT